MNYKKGSAVIFFKTELYMMNPSIPVKQAIEDTGFSDTFYFIRSVTEVV